MKKIVINGGKRISGTIPISGAKNSVVALIPATILANDVVTLEGVPDISDVASLVEIMEIMGAKIERNLEEGRLVIDTRSVVSRPLMEKSTLYVLLIISMVHFWDVLVRQQ